MIIWGSRGITSVVETGQFHCPQCSDSREFKLKQVRSFFTLYFIPIIPLNVAGRYVECATCRGTFAENAKSFDPEKERSEMLDQMLRVMILAAMADGQADENELAEIKKQYVELAGLPATQAKLQSELAMAASAGVDLNKYVQMIAGNLSAHGKALVVKLSFFTMSANGELQPGHQTQLAGLGRTLKIPEDQFVELINRLSGGED